MIPGDGWFARLHHEDGSVQYCRVICFVLDPLGHPNGFIAAGNPGLPIRAEDLPHFVGYWHRDNKDTTSGGRRVGKKGGGTGNCAGETGN